MSAIGCHAQHLACFAAASPCDASLPMPARWCRGADVIDYASALIEFDTGARGTFTVDASGRRRRERYPVARLRREGNARLVASRARLSEACAAGRGATGHREGRPFPSAAVAATSRTPRGHPEGLREAFANIYAEVAQHRIALALGQPCRSSRIRGSTRARTRWRSSRRALRRRRAAAGWMCRAVDRVDQIASRFSVSGSLISALCLGERRAVEPRRWIGLETQGDCAVGAARIEVHRDLRSGNTTLRYPVMKESLSTGMLQHATIGTAVPFCAFVTPASR